MDAVVTLTLTTNADGVTRRQSFYHYRHNRGTQQPASHHNHLVDHRKGEPDNSRHPGELRTPDNDPITGWSITGGADSGSVQT